MSPLMSPLISPERLKRAVECLIFISDKPLPRQSLYTLFPENKRSEINSVLEDLVREWSQMDRGFNLFEVSDGLQFRTLAEFNDDILRFTRAKPFKLSRAALEVISIIAYKQPVTKVEVDQIRGVDSSGVIGVLLDKEIVEIRGRKEIPGRPFIYGTTGKFLETFSLKNLNDLPTLSELEEIESSATNESSL